MPGLHWFASIPLGGKLAQENNDRSRSPGIKKDGSGFSAYHSGCSGYRNRLWCCDDDTIYHYPAPQTTAIPKVVEINRIKVDEAKALVESGQAILLDVRTAESYASQHAAGAVLFPEAKELEFLSQLPKDKILIFYCT
ncbi:MAG: rhodanese-like domain-containing protein [Anaerolineae bacterium]